MLTTELEHVEERFAEIVAGLEAHGTVWAKVDPMEFEGDGPSREEDLEPWDDGDEDGEDVEFP
ncbi:hypothetical protein F4561_006478 [Lipingzhangella halophila]|uniref:Uncharacterized protein n=1 Tax=Lipingzhangella halophila TaxID=1783352 RepID=A0A7W7RP52_9ACTN|nr:hypothetical protein [Lipingzhangella halophila]MBB4935584.1 hypothetical protein [Lipingzhangella halophila]